MSLEMSGSKTEVYSIKFFFKGRRIAEESEPPADLIDEFIDFVADGIIHQEWDANESTFIEHNSCDEDCAVEACLIFGWPYTSSVREAFAV